MIDLHIHSTHSDGTYTPIELLKKAEEIGLEMISITDHDNIDAHIDLQNINIKEYYSGEVITGIELKTAYKSVPIEILGYGVNVQKIKRLMNIQAENKRNVQIKYLEYLKSVGRKIGLKFNEAVQVGDENIWAGLTFVNSIDKTDVNKEIIEKYNIGLNGDTFYRNCQSNPDNIFYIDEAKDMLSPKEIIKEIHNAGGIAFLAHPLIYSWGDMSRQLEIVEEFIKEYEIDGLECYHSLFSEEGVQRLLEMCDKYNLYKSGGSDYHGIYKPYIELGTGKENNLNISKDLVTEWINKIN